MIKKKRRGLWPAMALNLMVLLLCVIGWHADALAQETQIYSSENLPRPDTVWVFKPQKSTGDKKLPLLFLLHGYGGNYKQWHSIMNAQQYADEYGFIIVCPDGLFSSWYLNSPAQPHLQFERFFFDELMPDIRSKYPVDEKNIFISGLSMGGHGALYLFLKKPALFKSAGSTSGGVRLSDSFGKYGLGEVLGNPPADSPLWDDYSVIHQIATLSDKNKPFIFDCGAGDPFYAANNALKAKCDSLHLQATYISQPGGHNRAYWTQSIRQQMNFFKSHLN